MCGAPDLKGSVRLWRSDGSSLLRYLILIGIFPLTYYVTYPMKDYPQPIEPAVAMLATAGACPWKRLKR